MIHRSKVRICLWFEAGGLDVLQFYICLLPWSMTDSVLEKGEPSRPDVSPA